MQLFELYTYAGKITGQAASTSAPATAGLMEAAAVLLAAPGD